MRDREAADAREAGLLGELADEVGSPDAAETFADLSTVLFIAGVVLTGAGVTMVILSPSKTSPSSGGVGLVLTPIGAGGTF